MISQEFWNKDVSLLFEKKNANVELTRNNTAYSEKKIFKLKRLYHQDIESIIKLQDEIKNNLEDLELLVEITHNEIYNSMSFDFCYGLFDNTILAAFCIIILNRNTKENYAIKFKSELNDIFHFSISPLSCITFDSIQVSQEYRGYGIQRFFLDIAEEIARSTYSNIILTTVSPDNVFSIKNFENSGFNNLFKTWINEPPYNGKYRIIYGKMLK